jgi:hypothetical protein
MEFFGWMRPAKTGRIEPSAFADRLGEASLMGLAGAGWEGCGGALVVGEEEPEGEMKAVARGQLRPRARAGA